MASSSGPSSPGGDSVSVVIPTFNRSRRIVAALRSVLTVLKPGDEVIVVDDGSTDDTAAVLAPFRERIRYIGTPNRGCGAARNRGIREATKALVAFLDSDDEWMADKLLLQRRVLAARPDVLFCFSDFAVRDDAGREQRFHLKRWHKDPRSWTEILGPSFPFSSIGELPPQRPDFDVYVGSLYLSEMSANYVFTSTLLARRQEAGDALRFAEDVPINEDWECVGRLARIGSAAYLSCETAWNGGHSGPRISDADEFMRATNLLIVLGRIWGSDAGFLAAHEARYRAVVTEQHLVRARTLLRNGRTDDAQVELRHAERAPLKLRVAAALPGPLVRSVMRVLRPEKVPARRPEGTK